jgi:hypothetical protein
MSRCMGRKRSSDSARAVRSTFEPARLLAESSLPLERKLEIAPGESKRRLFAVAERVELGLRFGVERNGLAPER